MLIIWHLLVSHLKVLKGNRTFGKSTRIKSVGSECYEDESYRERETENKARKKERKLVQRKFDLSRMTILNVGK